MKIKLSLKVEEIAKGAVLNFYETKENALSYSLDLPEAIYPVKHLIWRVLQKYSSAEYSQLYSQKDPS